MLKIINALLLSMILVFGVVFGITSHNTNVARASANAIAQEQIKKELQDYSKSLSDDLSITQKNKNDNKSDGSSPSQGGGAAEQVPTGSFKELYSYAVKKLNLAQNVYARSTGIVHLIKGSALGVPVENEMLAFSTETAKSKHQKYFSIKAKGGPIAGFNIDMQNTHYSDGTNTTIYVSQNDIRRTSDEEYQEKYKWNMVSPFHLADEKVVNALSDDEILSFIYDSKKKEYISEIAIDVSDYNSSNFGSIFMGLTGADKHPNYKTLSMRVIIGENGLLKSITYNEHFDSAFIFDLSGTKINVSADIKLNRHTITYDVIDNSFVKIEKPGFV